MGLQGSKDNSVSLPFSLSLALYFSPRIEKLSGINPRLDWAASPARFIKVLLLAKRRNIRRHAETPLPIIY